MRHVRVKLLHIETAKITHICGAIKIRVRGVVLTHIRERFSPTLIINK